MPPLPRAFAVVLLAVPGGPLSAVPRLPLEDFTRQPDFSHLQISDDGKYVAYMHESLGHDTLNVADLATMESLRFDPGETQAFGTIVPKEVEAFQWISDRRLLLTTTVWDTWFGERAVNRDGTDWRGVSGYETLPLNQDRIFINLSPKDVLWAQYTLHAFDDAEGDILMLDQHDYSGVLRLYPDVIKINTETGSWQTVVKNPGDVVSWGVDRAGQVRLGIVGRGGREDSVIYRDNNRDAWRTFPAPAGLQKVHPLFFDGTNQGLYVAALSPEKRTALFHLTLGGQSEAKLVLSDPEYDIVSQTFTPSMDGVAMARPIFSEQKASLLGVWFVRDAPRVQWFDKQFVAYQRAIDRTLPNTINLYAGKSRDDQRVLFFAFSDRDPGTYVLLDAVKHSIKPIAPRMPQIHPVQMAEMLSIHYAARDGLEIRGYLTLPVGYPPKHLPLVVLPHGGPWVRDVWGFDPLVQFLANRGYAVLQMNYRGSPGYGDEFFEKGKREVGLAVQNDIEDAAKWAVAAGVADPQRVAILGGSYGGYSALFALGRSPGLYRCGISISGVTDWFSIYHNLDDPEYQFARRYWEDQIGDPRTEAAFLKSISPLNFADAITKPVLIIQGKDDRTVPVKQARMMVAALEKAGRPPETLYLSQVGHNVFATEDSRTAIFKAVESFLERNLGPGVPPAEAAK